MISEQDRIRSKGNIHESTCFDDFCMLTTRFPFSYCIERLSLQGSQTTLLEFRSMTYKIATYIISENLPSAKKQHIVSETAYAMLPEGHSRQTFHLFLKPFCQDIEVCTAGEATLLHKIRISFHSYRRKTGTKKGASIVPGWHSLHNPLTCFRKAIDREPRKV